VIRLCDIVCTYTLWHLKISLILRDILPRPYFLLRNSRRYAGQRNWENLKELTLNFWATAVSVTYADTCVHQVKLSIWGQEGRYNKGNKFFSIILYRYEMWFHIHQTKEVFLKSVLYFFFIIIFNKYTFQCRHWTVKNMSHISILWA
jgi:hypothetical protein